MESNIKALRKAIKGAAILDNTVIRFEHEGRSYAAIFKGGKWWSTSTMNGLAVFTNEVLAERVAAGDFADVKIATAWENL